MFLTDLLWLPGAKWSDMAGPFPCLSLVGTALPIPTIFTPHHSLLSATNFLKI